MHENDVVQSPFRLTTPVDERYLTVRIYEWETHRFPASAVTVLPTVEAIDDRAAVYELGDSL
jgi:hypothetical protein